MAFDIEVFDEPPRTYSEPTPPARAWHVWHRWVRVRVDSRTTYVGCATCGRPRTPTIFEPPVP